MQAKADTQLLREYARQGSEAAFGEIVARYTDLVYSAVLRQVGSAALAEDVVQSVFTDLARKAPSLAGRLDENGAIVGWLYRSSRYAVSKHLRAEHRRHNRESQAMQHFWNHRHRNCRRSGRLAGGGTSFPPPIAGGERRLAPTSGPIGPAAAVNSAPVERGQR
jgi:DNA-directed RNA polymerase specialized sigma24 family protein